MGWQEAHTVHGTELKVSPVFLLHVKYRCSVKLGSFYDFTCSVRSQSKTTSRLGLCSKIITQMIQSMRIASSYFHCSSAGFVLGNGRIVGKARTSRICDAFVKSCTTRSMPIPQPAVGGKPNSKASQKAVSGSGTSMSPRYRSCACISNRRRCSRGSFNSSYALIISLRATKSSNLAAMSRP